MLLALSVGAAAMLTAAATAGAGNGPPHLGIYVNGVLYRTVGTPTDFSTTQAPLASFETLYNFGTAQSASVATAAPGDPGFRGGRWQVHAIVFNTSYADTLAAHDSNGSGSLDSAAEVQAALNDPGSGGATDGGVVKLFECPVIAAN
ncbi:MAG TPA: hypothetical protein VGH92_08180 [Gaiellaceae bacterium]